MTDRKEIENYRGRRVEISLSDGRKLKGWLNGVSNSFVFISTIHHHKEVNLSDIVSIHALTRFGHKSKQKLYP